MATITYRQPDGSSATVDVPTGSTVMRGAVLNGVPGILAECGGGAMCGTCHVYVDPGRRLPEMLDVEDELLHGTASPRLPASRLSCQLTVTDELDGLVVGVPEHQV